MRRVEFHPEAFMELSHACLWYDRQAVGLGAEFLKEVEGAIRSIRELPKAWPFYIQRTRRFFVHHFPYAIVYRVDKEKIQIFAVTHLHRRPYYWRNRQS